MSPFKVVYGRNPPSIRSDMAVDARLLMVHKQMLDRDEFLMEIGERLDQVQQHYKMFYDKKHQELM
jgi:hypothetical protein